jgi:chloramphenicol 3-O-phosphotransferase
MIGVYQNKKIVEKKRFKKVDRKRGYFRGSKIGVKKGQKGGCI